MSDDDDRFARYRAGLAEYGDAELQASIVELARMRDHAAVDGCHVQAAFLADLLDVTCDHRDRRAELRRAIEDALCPVQVVGIVGPEARSL